MPLAELNFELSCPRGARLRVPALARAARSSSWTASLRATYTLKAAPRRAFMIAQLLVLGHTTLISRYARRNLFLRGLPSPVLA